MFFWQMEGVAHSAPVQNWKTLPETQNQTHEIIDHIFQLCRVIKMTFDSEGTFIAKL